MKKIYIKWILEQEKKMQEQNLKHQQNMIKHKQFNDSLSFANTIIQNQTQSASMGAFLNGVKL